MRRWPWVDPSGGVHLLSLGHMEPSAFTTSSLRAVFRTEMNKQTPKGSPGREVLPGAHFAKASPHISVYMSTLWSASLLPSRFNLCTGRTGSQTALSRTLEGWADGALGWIGSECLQQRGAGLPPSALSCSGCRHGGKADRPSG